MAVIPTAEQLSIVKKVELAILQEIRHVCEVHGIQYFICAGTLLGAVRHKGFIPWDDDIDIGMLRKDYNAFLKYVDELPHYLKVVNFHTTKACGEPFTKIMDTRATFKEIFACTTDAPAGIFVDIFVFDNVPDGYISRRLQIIKNYTLKKLILLNRGYNFQKTGVKRILYDYIEFIAKHISIEKLVKEYNKNSTKYINVNTKNVICLVGGDMGYKVIPLDFISRTVMLFFEKNLYPAPIEYDKFLKMYYGDYTVLPPKEQRINRHYLAELDVSYFEKIFDVQNV